MINFVADRVKISGPRVDGNFTITFDVGEYQYDNIKDIPKLNDDVLYVTVSNDERKTKEGS